MIEAIQGSVDGFGETGEGVGLATRHSGQAPSRLVVGGLWLIGLWSGGWRGNGLILGLLRHCFSPPSSAAADDFEIKAAFFWICASGSPRLDSPSTWEAPYALRLTISRGENHLTSGRKVDR
jgi:hypothetical protein